MSCQLLELKTRANCDGENKCETRRKKTM